MAGAHIMKSRRPMTGPERIRSGHGRRTMTYTRRTLGPGRHGHLKGGKYPPEYRVWTCMVQRCYNPRCREYPWYGERGIRVCDRWLAAMGFAHFVADVGW